MVEYVLTPPNTGNGLETPGHLQTPGGAAARKKRDSGGSTGGTRAKRSKLPSTITQSCCPLRNSSFRRRLKLPPPVEGLADRPVTNSHLGPSAFSTGKRLGRTSAEGKALPKTSHVKSPPSRGTAANPGSAAETTTDSVSADEKPIDVAPLDSSIKAEAAETNEVKTEPVEDSIVKDDIDSSQPATFTTPPEESTAAVDTASEKEGDPAGDESTAVSAAEEPTLSNEAAADTAAAAEEGTAAASSEVSAGSS